LSTLDWNPKKYFLWLVAFHFDKNWEGDCFGNTGEIDSYQLLLETDQEQVTPSEFSFQLALSWQFPVY
jgi:hypothetical protein